ncbi:MAG: NAD-dependent deacylase [Synergistaceae bacterium]|nr:NAD-dependent deacylase [Synergistota bacterium]NLM72332.1 NAD-dependent deacylase [Synergistaceae bacterium]
MENTVKKLADAIAASREMAVFTGAGMSTESGLPDFRSSDGLWKKYRPEELASIDALNRNFGEFASFYRQRIATLGEVQPNRGHLVLADWERRGLVKGIITQNVDGLHHAAGSTVVHELHGTLREVRCQSCGHVRPASTFADEAECDKCGGKMRPGVVLFGEMLPEDTLQASSELASSCGVFLVLGSSLTVSPANMLPERARRSGAKLFIVNKTPTHLDSLADGVIRTSIGETLASVDELIETAGG